MKHLGSQQADLLHSLLDEAGLEVSGEAQAQALRHLDWVLEANLTLNLTSVTDPLEAVRLHVLDSLLVLPEVEQAPEGLMVDLGSGAGFPGIPLSLASGRRTLLVDSVRKKARAVHQFLADSGLGESIEVWSGRAEELDLGPGRLASVVVVRAVSSLPSLVELASPILMQGGRLVAMKGRADELEVSRGQEVGRVTGMRPIGYREYELSLGGERRSVHTYERQGEPLTRLPRRTGLAQRQPLA